MSTDPQTLNAIRESVGSSTAPMPDPAEAERRAITSHKDWFTGGPEKPALLERMRRLGLAPEERAAENLKRNEAEAKITPSEARRRELNDPKNEAGIYSKDPAKQRAAMVELKKILAAGDTPEERAALVESGIEGARGLYGFTAPPEYIATFGKDVVKNYEENFSGHEAELLRHARVEAWDKSLVSDLREYGVRLGVEISARQTGMTADEVAEFKAKFKGRLTAAQADQLIAWFQARVVGGAS
jgi:hypothetical protein